MSFGNSWASCHTIDTENTRINNGTSHFHGEYCAGTLSYAGDNCTLLLYTVSKDYDNTSEMWKADKLRRCCFYVSPKGEVLVQSRVYPDGRDGGDTGIAAQFRAIMQDVIAQCYNIPNNWTFKSGTGHVCQYTEQNYEAACYPDWTCYNDVNVSLNKEFTTYPKITIGVAPICPVCGNEHDRHDRLVCMDCGDYVTCGWCDDEIRREDSDTIRDVNYEDSYYCCESCARNAGLHWITSAEEWTSSDDIFEDPYDCNYYYDQEAEVITEDGTYYYSEYNAERDGFIEAETETGSFVWIRKDDAYEHSDGDWYTYEEEEEEEVG